jgi:hypothetical protein
MTGQAQQTQRTAADIEAELTEIDAAIAEVGAGEDTDDVGASPEGDNAAAEVQATRQGWVDKEHYKGDPKKWVDAKTFLERGERFTKNLENEVATLRRKIEEFEGTKAAFKKFHEETIARKDEELKNAIAALRVQRSEAQSEGEHETVVALEDRIDLLKMQQKELKAPIEQVAPAVLTSEQAADMAKTDPVLAEWVEDGNAWFSEDAKLRQYALNLGENLIKSGETVRGRPFLDKVSELMRRDFPRYFRTAPGASNLANATSASSTGSGAQAGGGKTGVGAAGKTERDLPKEDLELMRQFVKEGWMTKEKFLANYFSR